MKLYRFIFLLCLSYLFAFNVAAQDSSAVKKNLFYFEVFGNNFPGLPLSVNYSRRIIKEKISLQPSIGVGFPRLRSSKFIFGFPDVSLNASILARGKYKTNALWASFSGSLGYGYWDSDKGPYNFSFELGAAYQVQWSKEKFFARFSLGMKISSELFYNKKDPEAHLFYPSAGICLGRGANFHVAKDSPGSRKLDKVSPLTDNLVYVEFLGSTYGMGSGMGSLFDGNLLSLNYCRKFRHVMLFGGVGLPRRREASRQIKAYTLYALDAGLLFRIGYKRNAFWASFSGSISNYKRIYTNAIHRSYGGPSRIIYIYHDVDFDLTPGICYQAQSRDEHFCFRFTAGVKIFSVLLADSYYDYSGRYDRMYPWLGIGIGTGW